MLDRITLNYYKSKLNETINSIVGPMYYYCHNPSTLYEAIEWIGNTLNKLNRIIDTNEIGEAPWYPPYRPFF